MIIAIFKAFVLPNFVAAVLSSFVYRVETVIEHWQGDDFVGEVGGVVFWRFHVCYVGMVDGRGLERHILQNIIRGGAGRVLRRLVLLPL